MLKVTLAACLIVSLANAQSPLTNTDIIHMVGYGISPAIVKATINRSKAQFDLTPEGLMQLKNAGLKDDVIIAMLSKNSTNISAPAKDTLGNLATGIYYRSAEKYITLEPDYLTSIVSKGMAGKLKKTLSGFIPFSIKASLGGAKGLVRFAERKPSLLFILDYPVRSPEEFFLVRLQSTDSSRQLVFGKPTSASGPIVVNDSLKINFSIKKLENGFYEVSPGHPLPPGEYGFIYCASSFYAGIRYKIYDFSIIEK